MIVYELGSCSLGCVLVAMSEKGVCAIALGDEPSQLVDWLKQKYPHARKGAGNAVLLSRLQRVLNYAEWPESALNIELDIKGTEFQKRVWQALQTVPAGETRSYSEIAEKIGSPKSVRAVAGACAANLLALAIPCHRVIRQDGEMSGYRWGVERKKMLLQKEAFR
jgi:AraC family transcriptional regulator of adaptative response/methylated-DNA-[protein]-cysteine methyltransferase